ncbi:hypothetical protein [Olleya sp. YS]|uniref:hypothetical protein n=1 Tax=Olleya sp. YS TaxID=3028318 RepID=UPI00243451DA|nr:hypothetical protein [Olleya sp. YS]WGD33850.1 hypothetical protein Ollyesu_08665 [Olleya sp. YS]
MRNKLLFIGFIVLLFSCGNEKIVQLPEIQNAEITKVLDVSPAYIFYDETKQDSVELNRKNLIISTNWLVNVDKRLTLKQALPSIIKLQDKKRNASMHKNEKARNYFTCNDTSIKNLGFIDFTDVEYHFTYNDSINTEIITEDDSNEINIIIEDLDNIDIDSIIINAKTNIHQLNHTLESIFNYELFEDNKHSINYHNINIGINKNLSFQDYITVKSKLENFKNDKKVINNHEFIY